MHFIAFQISMRHCFNLMLFLCRQKLKVYHHSFIQIVWFEFLESIPILS